MRPAVDQCQALGCRGVAGWSLAQISHVLVATVTGFFSVRVALAVTEAVNLPAAVKTVATWFRGGDRSLALGIMNLAPNLGAVATPLLVPIIAVAWGWKAAFIATGALGLVWLVFWFALPKPLARSQPAPADLPDRNLAAFRRLLGDRRLWAVALGKFLTDLMASPHETGFYCARPLWPHTSPRPPI